MDTIQSKLPNDPSSPTTPTATVERTENVGISETVERKAGATFGAAPLLGVISSSPRGIAESNESLPLSQIHASNVDALTWQLLQKNPSKCLVLFYCILARLFAWRRQVFQRLADLERQTNTYYGLSQSYIWFQDCFGGLPRRVMVTPNVALTDPAAKPKETL